MSLQGTTLVCFAVGQEGSDFRHGRERGSRVKVVVSGMGSARARAAVERAIQTHRPDQVLTCGFAGGLDPALQVGAVVFETRVESMASVLRAAGARPARFHCADRIAITDEEKASLRSRTQADAVEMESQSIHQVCVQNSLPCATLRVISDAASDTLPLDFNQLLNAELQLSPMKLALRILRSPGRIPGLMKLGRQSAFAAGRLAEVLEAVLGLEKR